MRLDSRSGLRGHWVRKDTWQKLGWVVWADTDSGEYERFSMDPDEARAAGIPLSTVKERGRCAAGLAFVPDPAIARARPAPPPAPDRSPVAWPCLSLPDRPCEAYGCTRPADYQVSDFQKKEPETARGRCFGRASVAKVHYYCAWHYRLPRQVQNGEVVEKIEVVTQPGWTSG